MAKLNTYKESVGEGFWDFYFNSKLTYISFLSTLLVCLLFVLAVTYQVDPYFIFNPRTLGLSIINSLIISYTVVDKKRDFYKRKNGFIDDLKNRNPVYSKDVTKEFHHIITECFDPDHTILVKTDVGVVERKVKEIPNRNLKPFSEIFKEIIGSLVTFK